MRIDYNEAITFDDVLLVPTFNDIESRKNVDTKTVIVDNKIVLGAPIISANMDTVTGQKMLVEMGLLGGMGILHRFMSLIDLKSELAMIKHALDNFGISFPVCVALGVGDYVERAAIIKEYGFDFVCVDVAHGHSKIVKDVVSYLKTNGFYVMAGNVCTPEGAEFLAEAGADSIKVGVGGGSMCSTRIVTGNGVPTLTSIIECAASIKSSNPSISIIADGGIRNSGDIAKALAAGADACMVGSLLSGCPECPGEIIIDHDSGRKYKKYRGMASAEAMDSWKGAGYHAAPEGESKLVECKAGASEIVTNLVAGLRSAMTYQGAKDLMTFRNNAILRLVSGNSVVENKPHGK